MKINIGQKLMLGFGILVLIWAASGILNFTQLQTVRRDLAEITEVEEPSSYAALEMEINLIGTGFGLLGYLHDHDQEHLDRIHGDEEDFEAFQAQYHELAETERGKALGVEIDQGYDQFKGMADELIKIEDEQTTKMEALLEASDQMDDLLDDNIQAAIQPDDQQAYQKLQAALEMEINANGIAKGLGNFLRTHRADYKERILKDEQDFNQYLVAYESLLLSSQEKQWAEQIRHLFDESVKLAQDIVDLDEMKEQKLAEFVVARRELDIVLDDEIQALTHTDLAASKEEALQSVETAVFLTVSLLVIGITIAAGTAFVLTRSIAKPLATVAEAIVSIASRDLEELGQALERLAGGDLTGEFRVSVEPISFKSKDEVGQIAASFNSMVQRLRESGEAFGRTMVNLQDSIQQVIESANSVRAASVQLTASADQSAQAANQVATTIQQVATGTAQQASSVTAATTTVEQVAQAIDGVARGAQEQAAAVGKSAEITAQISSVVQQVALNAQAGAEGAAQATQAARVGSDTVEKTIEGMNNIKTSTDLVAQRVQEMGRRSEQIGAIVETIDDIASQTNLLALNAAIEAARAGEHGKGFAVVADEVRKLAESATTATQEIAGLIKTIQQAIGEAVQAMETGAAEVEAGMVQADEAGQALDAILVAAETVNQQVVEIASAAQQMDASANELVGAMDSVSAVVEENTASTEEMAAGAGEVSQAMESIASISEENSAATEEVSATVEEVSAQVEEVTASAQSLAAMAQQLQALVSQFRLPGVQAGSETGMPVDEGTRWTTAPTTLAAADGGNGRQREDSAIAYEE